MAMGGRERILRTIDELANPQLKLIVEIGYHQQNAKRHYRLIQEKLQKIYG